MTSLRLQQLSMIKNFLGVMRLAAQDRETMAKAAALVLKAITSRKAVNVSDDLQPAVEACRPMVLAIEAMIAPGDRYRTMLEKTMTVNAQRLPVVDFVESIRGFGYLGLSIILGEAGDLANYSNPAKLWKRLGLAVIDGKSQRKSTNAEEAIRQGYKPQRRSAMFTIGDSLLKAKNSYKLLYDLRKRYERDRAPTMTKLHSHLRAQRYAEKRLLRDLWRAWRDAMNPAQSGGDHSSLVILAKDVTAASHNTSGAKVAEREHVPRATLSLASTRALPGRICKSRHKPTPR